MVAPVVNYLLPPPPRLSDITSKDSQIVSTEWFKYFGLLQKQVTTIVDTPTSLTLVDVSQNYTALSTDDIISVFASGGNINITLPSNPTSGHSLTIHKSDSTTNMVSIIGNGNSIENALTYHLNNPGETVTISYDSAISQNKWLILSKISDAEKFRLIINNGVPITGDAKINNSSDIEWTNNSGTITATLPYHITAGTNTKVTYDSKGRVVSSTAAQLDSGDYAGQGLANTVLRGSQYPSTNPNWGKVDLTTDISGILPEVHSSSLHGDVSKAGGNTATVLATVNSNIGVFGNQNETPTITVNAKGLVTAAANVTINLNGGYY